MFGFVSKKKYERLHDKYCLKIEEKIEEIGKHLATQERLLEYSKENLDLIERNINLSLENNKLKLENAKLLKELKGENV